MDIMVQIRAEIILCLIDIPLLLLVIAIPQLFTTFSIHRLQMCFPQYGPFEIFFQPILPINTLRFLHCPCVNPKFALQEPEAEVEARQEGFRLLAHLAVLGASELSKWMSQRIDLWKAISRLPMVGLGELRRAGLLLTVRVLEHEGASGLSLPSGTSAASTVLSNALVRPQNLTSPPPPPPPPGGWGGPEEHSSVRGNM